jgi:hypothetical protein
MEYYAGKCPRKVMKNELESHGKVMEFCDPTFVGTLLKLILYISLKVPYSMQFYPPIVDRGNPLLLMKCLGE